MGLALDELNDDDSKIHSNGIDLIVKEEERLYFQNSIIDFEESFYGNGLVIRPSYGGGC